MMKTTTNNEITSVTGLTGFIKSVTFNHKTLIMTVAYANEVEIVDPAEDWKWWDTLASLYFC